MDKRCIFDKEVLNYEKRRPRYTPQLFEDIINYGGITENKSIIEIGCGTGQATEPFLKTNCKVTAVEPGENMAAYISKKFKNYANFDILQSSFEDYTCGENQYDMLYSATAFHWIPPEIGYKKAYKIIKHGGTLALFWNRPGVNDKKDRLHQKIQSVYREYLPQWGQKADSELSARYSAIKEAIAQYGFTDIEFHLYHNTRALTGEEYIELLSTYSDHRELDEKVRLPFFSAIKSVIEQSGNELLIHDTIDLYLAHKN